MGQGERKEGTYRICELWSFLKEEAGSDRVERMLATVQAQRWMCMN